MKNSYKFEGWQSITLEQFIELQKGIDKEPDELVLHLCSTLFNQDSELVKKAYKWADLVDFANKVMATFDELPKREELTKLSLNGVEYYPPSFVSLLNGDWWSNSTYGQVQSVMSTINTIEKHKDMSTLPLMFAALFRKKGEELTDEIIVKREILFSQMTMDKVWQAFFLLKKWERSTQKGLKRSLIINLQLLKLANWILKLKTSLKRKNKNSQDSGGGSAT